MNNIETTTAPDIQAAALVLGLDNRNHKALTLLQAKTLPVIHSGHFENTLFETRLYRVTHSRMTCADGARYPNEIAVSEYNMKSGGYDVKRRYQAK